MIRPSSSDLTAGQQRGVAAVVAFRLRELQLRQQLHRQVHLFGISALPEIVALAVFSGAAAVTQVTVLAGTGSDVAQK